MHNTLYSINAINAIDEYLLRHKKSICKRAEEIAFQNGMTGNVIPEIQFQHVSMAIDDHLLYDKGESQFKQVDLSNCTEGGELRFKLDANNIIRWFHNELLKITKAEKYDEYDVNRAYNNLFTYQLNLDKNAIIVSRNEDGTIRCAFGDWREGGPEGTGPSIDSAYLSLVEKTRN